MVEEIKKKEYAVRQTQFLYLGTIITGILLLVMMFLMPENTESWLQTTIMIAFVTNMAPMIYFDLKIRHLKGKTYDWEKELRRSKLVTLVVFVLIIIFIAYLYTL